VGVDVWRWPEGSSLAGRADGKDKAKMAGGGNTTSRWPTRKALRATFPMARGAQLGWRVGGERRLVVSSGQVVGRK